MRAEGLHVRIGRLPTGAHGAAVFLFAAVKAHLVDAVHQLADLVFLDQVIGVVRGLGEIVVEVAAQVELVLGGVIHQRVGIGIFGADGLFHQHGLLGLEGLHGRLKVHGAVVVTGSGDADHVDFRVRGEHFLRAGIPRDVEFLAEFLGLLGHDIAHGHEGGEFVFHVATACVRPMPPAPMIAQLRAICIPPSVDGWFAVIPPCPPREPACCS